VRAVAWALLVVALTPWAPAHGQEGGGLNDALNRSTVPSAPGAPVTLEGHGQSHQQPVSEPAAALEVDLAGADVAQIGGAYALDISVRNAAAVTAKNVRVRVAVTLPAAAGPRPDPATVVRYAGATAMQCTVYERDRVCAFGDIPAGGTVTGQLLADVAATAGAGSVTFSVTARLDNRAAGAEPTDQKVVALAATSRAAIDVDLAVSIERQAAKIGSGAPVVFVIGVRNGSDRHPAMATELEIRQRFGERAGATFRPVSGALRTTIRGDDGGALTCTPTRGGYRCPLGTLAPGAARRITVEDVVVHRLERGRWGRLEVHARARSAERDPTINFARAFTNVLSRVPEVAVFTRGRDEHGQPGIVPSTTVAVGDTFGVAVRFMDVAAEPATPRIRVKLVAPGAAVPVEVPLTGGSDGIYRSAQLRLMLPGETAADGAAAVVHAREGAAIRIVYEQDGAPAAETIFTVRRKPSSTR
jgi:hypothetical protein